jgi:ribosomal protein S18 acetylase RimI-like enzyme
MEPEHVLDDADAGELLTLQRAAYITEAQLHRDPFLPPLTETLAEVREALADRDVTIIGVHEDGRLIGSIRVRRGPEDMHVAHIARLAVAPDRQGEGIGTRLLAAAEVSVAEGVEELRLFTGEYSERNLRLYERLGYRETHRAPAGDHDLVFLSKRAARPAPPAHPPAAA